MTTPILTLTLNPVVDISSETDSVHPIHKIRTFDQRQEPGGGGINVSRVITQLGGESEAIYLAGGATGELLEELLDRMEVPNRKIPISGETRIGFNVYERKTGFEYRFLPEGPMVTQAELNACLNAIRVFEGDYVVASGSLPKGVPEDTLVEMADLCAEKGMKFIVDSSGPALVNVLEKGPIHVAKPSLRELSQVAGEPLDEMGARKVAMNLVIEGKCEMVAVTLGTQGAILAHKDGILRLPARQVNTKSAVGAGDSFLAAMIWALSDGWSHDEAFRLGVAAGAAASITPGTELCHKHDVFRFYESGAQPMLAPSE